jgi:fructose-1,6-bisphosphatase II
VVHAGYDLDRVYTLDELCSAEDTHFAATGITDGTFLRGVRYGERRAWTESLVIRGATRTLRKVEAWHQLEKLRGISPVAY